uniref:Uncharacterized protein n=1 Tax=Arundo donax TaxID=35708 RepID=A0A0A9SFX7_ARUDO
MEYICIYTRKVSKCSIRFIDLEFWCRGCAAGFSSRLRQVRDEPMCLDMFGCFP